MVSITADDNAPVGLRHWLILATVQITTLTFGMTITAANVVLPQLKGAMSATPDQIAWVVTFNLVATAIATPLTGWLAQTLGWRNLIFVSLTGFTIFSGLCGLANSLESLVLFRVGQGAFGAPLLPLGQSGGWDLVPSVICIKVLKTTIQQKSGQKSPPANPNEDPWIPDGGD